MEYGKIASRNLKKIMEKRGLTVAELATLSGVSKTTIYSILKEAQKEIYLHTAYHLCKALKITLTEFFSED